MARMESKSEQVVPADEQKTIRLYEDFGWTLQSSQEVVDNYLSKGAGGSIYQNRSRHLKLIFQRDKDMPHYAEIARLESEYNAALNAVPSGSLQGIAILMCCLLATLPIGLLLLLLNRGRNKRDKAAASAAYATAQSLREQAKRLC